MKKVFALITGLALVMGLLAACGNSGSSSAKGGESKVQNTSETESGKLNYSQQEPYTLTILFYGDADTANVDKVSEALSALSVPKFNTTIKLIRVGFGSYMQQVNLMLSSGEGIDVFGNMGQISTMAANGMALPLKELLEKYGQDTLADISERDWACTTVNGEIFGIPSNKDKAFDFSFVMTKSMADELSIDPTTIKTMDDVHDALVKAKEKYPNVYGLGPNVGTMVPSLLVDPLGSSEYYLGCLLNPRDPDDLTVQNLFSSNFYLEWTQRMYDWNREGLLMPDASTSTETHLSLRASGMMFGNFATTKPGFAEQESRSADVDITVSQLFSPVSFTSNGAMGWSIAPTSKDPARAMQILDWLYNDFEASNMVWKARTGL